MCARVKPCQRLSFLSFFLLGSNLANVDALSRLSYCGRECLFDGVALVAAERGGEGPQPLAELLANHHRPKVA